jgi:DNA-binding SARP family transcriptional activator
LQENYLILLDGLGRYYYDQEDYAACTTICRKILIVDPCFEDAHRQLMRCYSRQGQRYLALRQYHLCVEALNEELEANPTSATTELYERIRRHQQV